MDQESKSMGDCRMIHGKKFDGTKKLGRSMGDCRMVHGKKFDGRKKLLLDKPPKYTDNMIFFSAASV
ncbi:hypothetical protein C5167_016761 [Papaver somniferum]|nr:hypothetical protein C5167_016761 [Papaver somniferum]